MSISFGLTVFSNAIKRIIFQKELLQSTSDAAALIAAVLSTTT